MMIIFHVLRLLSIAHAASFRGGIKQRGAVTGRSGTHDLPSETGSPIFAKGVDSLGANDSAKSGTVLEEDPTSSSGLASVDSDEGLRRHRRLLALDWVGNEGIPASAFPLGECQGECDSDEDCQGDLICYERGERESVPGCSGNGRKRKDYCAFRPDNYLRYITKGINPTSGMLGLCLGDCDLDDHCIEDYICYQRDGYTPVPGCDGEGRRGTDYCIPGPTNCRLLSPTISSDIVNQNSIACVRAQPLGGTTDQKWARCYVLGGCSESRTLDSVTFGVERISGDGAVPLKVNVWKDSGCLSGNPGTAGELVASINTEASASEVGSLVTVDIDSDVELAPSDAIRVEIEQELDGRDSGQPFEFFPGTNDLGQTASGYYLAPDCGVDSFMDLADIGSPSVHLLLDVQTSPA